jgi:hypothetical protein
MHYSKIFALVFSAFIAVSAFAQDRYPMGPNPSLTPGSKCESDNTRHPQNIPYCKRSVSSSEKWQVIEEYNRLGANITRQNRGRFKVDHLIPLCIGGSNELDNLWPQHESIYVQTDDVEHMTCELVSRGEMKQTEAIELVLTAKNHLELAAGIRADLEKRLGRRLH